MTSVAQLQLQLTCVCNGVPCEVSTDTNRQLCSICYNPVGLELEDTDWAAMALASLMITGHVTTRGNSWQL